MSRILDFLQFIGTFALLLGPLVLIHELGHFAVAKFLGIRVEVFSIGFGRRLFGIRRGGTDYRLSLLPLGGYVKMQGENPDETISGDPQEFLSRPKRQRFAVLVMGATANIVAAVVLMAVVFRAGIPEPAYLTRPAVVGAVAPDSPAAKAGVRPGDRILHLGTKEIRNWTDLLTTVSLSPGQTTTLTLMRSGQLLTQEIRLEAVSSYQIGYAGILPQMAAQVTNVEPASPAEKVGLKPRDRVLKIDGESFINTELATHHLQNSAGKPVTLLIDRTGRRFEITVVPVEQDGKGRIGISWTDFPEQTIRKYPLGAAFRESLKTNWQDVGLLFTTIRKLLTKEISLRMMSGPIDISRISDQTFQEGWIHFLQFMARVSLQLGVINLLPFPVLDGGHILILLIEGLIRRDLSMKIKERVMQVGFYLLLLLMGSILYLDVAKNYEWFKHLFHL